MQPQALERDHGAPSGIPPPPLAAGGPRLVLEVEPAALAASQRRHPSSDLDPDHRTMCDECGFVPPPLAHAADALREVPAAWRDALRDSPLLVEQAARLRDELHAVANRVARLVTDPGARLSSVTIHAPTALAADASTNVLIELLHMAACRLAGLVDRLEPAEWVGWTSDVAEHHAVLADERRRLSNITTDWPRRGEPVTRLSRCAGPHAGSVRTVAVRTG